MRKIAICVIAAMSMTVFASQAQARQYAGKVYKLRTGEWGCIDKNGNDVPKNSKGKWTAYPIMAVGNPCDGAERVAANVPHSETPARAEPQAMVAEPVKGGPPGVKPPCNEIKTPMTPRRTN